MKRLIKFLSALSVQQPHQKTIDYKPSSNKVLKKDFNIGDKVKKQVFIGYMLPGKPREQYEDYIYGEIIFIENGYASVRFKNPRVTEREMFSNLILVSEEEWKYMARSGAW
ncbi:hypothetical protein HH214_21405 (plasmid) [Mucilaginibacter robiniae]|uniref:Uncharacterized protein n=1 Tax=Mucilaginibacter robiniae TaxID=2728022 RepID=A0A7L5EDI9_9SPHI|nr:hypothetical protein [Mucilaginibacter robiniae]QJD98516.1 hypothetical protein HH214_21405 [Mucilaginibacter robiniae]